MKEQNNNKQNKNKTKKKKKKTKSIFMSTRPKQHILKELRTTHLQV